MFYREAYFGSKSSLFEVVLSFLFFFPGFGAASLLPRFDCSYSISSTSLTSSLFREATFADLTLFDEADLFFFFLVVVADRARLFFLWEDAACDKLPVLS